jgi:NAD(P)-dependent dehydrogenase (short-subunit alcohol dehydrogenase family)
MKDVLGYSGKRVIVTGAASGMGAATTELLVELGAEVHAPRAVRQRTTASNPNFICVWSNTSIHGTLIFLKLE